MAVLPFVVKDTRITLALFLSKSLKLLPGSKISFLLVLSIFKEPKFLLSSPSAGMTSTEAKTMSPWSSCKRSISSRFSDGFHSPNMVVLHLMVSPSSPIITEIVKTSFT